MQVLMDLDHSQKVPEGRETRLGQSYRRMTAHLTRCRGVSYLPSALTIAVQRLDPIQPLTYCRSLPLQSNVYRATRKGDACRITGVC